jgi:hypothetical protein
MRGNSTAPGVYPEQRLNLRMRHESTPVELASFDPPVARAVVAVLRRAGIAADAADLETAEHAGTEATVRVPPEHRDAALSLVAARMEAVRQHVLEHERRVAPPTVVEEADELEPRRPLVLERFRRLGFIAVALVPALVITLANVRLPGAYVAAIVLGGIVLLTAWRTGRFGVPESR